MTASITRDPVVIRDPQVVAALGQERPDIGALWELCLQLEYDRAAIVRGLTGWLGAPDGRRILDCAAGSGFPAIDLAARGYDVTCSDGSSRMLEYLRAGARRAGVRLEPRLSRWADLARHFRGRFDVVMCRGSSLPYAGTWDADAEPDRGALAEAVGQFAACLRPGGMLYVDVTAAEQLADESPQHTVHPPLRIGGHEVELTECVRTDPARRIRTWSSTMWVDGVRHDFERRSHHVRHDELRELLAGAGLTRIRPVAVPGEHYAVFAAERDRG